MGAAHRNMTWHFWEFYITYGGDELAGMLCIGDKEDGKLSSGGR